MTKLSIPVLVAPAAGAPTKSQKEDHAPSEFDIERRAIEYARSLKIKQLKLNVTGSIGWPDRMFLKSGRVMFIEFKRPGERPRPAQVFMIELLQAEGFEVHVSDDFQHAKSLIDNFLTRL